MNMAYKVFALFVITYMCCNQVNAKKTEACEHAEDDFVKLGCGRNRAIHIKKANYGRIKGFKTRCPINKPESECTARNSKGIVKRKCEGKRSCSVKAANGVFGDPCIGFTKYLFVEYVCKPKRTRVACEHVKGKDHVRLGCPKRSKIYVIFANYGRNNKNGSCSNLNKPKVKVCKSKNSLGIVRRKCNGKRTCRVRAANDVFGDPCRGVLKYLYVQYMCV